MGAARGQLAAWSANSGELPPWPRWGKTAMRSYRGSIDPAERWRRWRRSRRGCRRTGQRVFAVVCSYASGDAWSAMADGRARASLRAVGGEEKRNGEASAFGRREWLQGTAATPGGARRVASATASRRRAAHTRPAFSETVGHCSAHSVDSDRLTA